MYLLLPCFVGAIKFGDSLSVIECEELIKSLSRCDLPFQYAHGRSVAHTHTHTPSLCLMLLHRPSMVPVVDLDALGKRYPAQQVCVCNCCVLYIIIYLCVVVLQEMLRPPNLTNFMKQFCNS